jgi:hypothetical protein
VRTRLLVLSATFLTVLGLSPAKNGAAQKTQREWTLLNNKNGCTSALHNHF